MRASLVLKRTLPFLPRVGSYIVSAVEEYRREVRMQRAVRHLRELPDHLLRDMDLGYSDITSMVRKGILDTSRRSQD